MLEADFRYILLRLGYSAEQPIAKALHRVLIKGDPYGPAARMFSVPSNYVAKAVAKARAIEAHFTVTAEEVDGLSPNQILAYVRHREAPAPETSSVVTAAQLKAAGLTDDQIKEILKCE